MNDPSKELRLGYIRLIVKATEAASKYRQSPEQVEREARVHEKRFAHVATEDLQEVLDLGQKCQAETIDEFLEVWNIEQESRRREAEIAARRKKSEAEQMRLTSPHPNRDDVFRKWGFA